MANRLDLPPSNSLYYSVPTPAPTPQVDPRLPLRQRLENLSAGLGYGLTGQLEDIKALATDPVGYGQNVLRSLRAIAQQPSILGNALRESARRAASGPLGAGEVAGGLLPLRLGGPAPVMRVTWPAPSKLPTNAELVYMSPQEYLAKVAESQKTDFSKLPFPVRKPKTIEKIRKALKQGEDIDTPWIKIKNGKIVDQEGRHRATAALEEGVEQIPVFVYTK